MRTLFGCVLFIVVLLLATSCINLPRYSYPIEYQQANPEENYGTCTTGSEGSGSGGASGNGGIW